MTFFILLYCLDADPIANTEHNCAAISIHTEKQHAINNAHEWCLFDHLCVGKTFVHETKVGPRAHQVPLPDTATNAGDKDTEPVPVTHSPPN